jgi:hypothetical protein
MNDIKPSDLSDLSDLPDLPDLPAFSEYNTYGNPVPLVDIKWGGRTVRYLLATERKKWEYRILFESALNFWSILTELGKEGWEAVSYEWGKGVFMKREIEEDENH